MSVLRAGDPGYAEAWARLEADDVLAHPRHNKVMRPYHREYHSACGFEDLSFVVIADGQPCVGMYATLRTWPHGGTDLCAFGPPVRYLEARDIDFARLQKAQKEFKAELGGLLALHSPGRVLYRDNLAGGTLSYLGRILLDLGGRATPFFTQMLDLTLAEAELHRQMSKSYRWRVNWGKNNLRVVLVNSDTVTPAHMEEFRLLHVREAGRETRSKHSWELQYDMVRANRAFLVFGYLGENLVTAALFSHSDQLCYYGVSVSRREMFDKPLSHVLIWSAALHAKSLGCRWFETGDQVFPCQGDTPPTAKELGIATFKRGFGGATHVRLDLVLAHADYCRLAAAQGEGVAEG